MSTLKTCLLIDDDQDDREIFLIALKDIGKEVECHFADNALMGLAQLDNNPNSTPDYIFVDLNMPGMNGRQCLIEIKNRDFLKAIPVIIYTTSSQPADMIELKALGAAAFITKPPSVKSLSKILSDFFEKHL